MTHSRQMNHFYNSAYLWTTNELKTRGCAKWWSRQHTSLHQELYAFYSQKLADFFAAADNTQQRYSEFTGYSVTASWQIWRHK